MTLRDYLNSKKADILQGLAKNGIEATPRQLEVIISFILDVRDGMDNLIDLFIGMFGLEVEKASAVDDLFYDVIYPRYDDFVKMNEQLPASSEDMESIIHRYVNRMNEPQGVQSGVRTSPPKASFYFSPEDEEEIRKISQQSTGGSQQKMEEIYNRVAGEVIRKIPNDKFQIPNKSQISNDQTNQSEDMEQSRRLNRLKNIIISRLKDARDGMETKEALSKPWKIGGMEVSAEEAERIVKEVEKAREALGEELKLLNVAMRQSANAAMRDREIASSVRPPRKDIIGKQDLSIPEIEAPHGEPQESRSKNQELGRESQGEKTMIHDSLFKIQRALKSNERPKVDSLVTTIPPAFSKPKLMGPVEELSTMSLEDFRRLGNAADAVRKLNDKVELLAADSLLEKKKGLDAWKKSEVYKIYLIMGTESLEKKMGIAEVVALRKKQNQPTLTTEEFAAVADLNRKISFSN